MSGLHGNDSPAITSSRAGGVVAVLVLVGAAAHYVLVELHRTTRPLPAGDIYGYFVPNILHAVHAVRDAGRGLLWNPYQSCGQPFFGNSQTGLLYPLHWLFLALEPNVAVHVVQMLNMVIGAAGMLLLARRLGAGPVAALGGALVFELSGPMAEFTSWSPMHSGPWGWVPWAMLLTDRILAGATRGTVVALTVVLALQMLPGFILIAALTYQLVLLRVAWEIAARRHAPPWRDGLAVLAALAVAPVLVAVQLVPMMELAGDSLRSSMSAASMLAPGQMSLSQLFAHTSLRIPPLPFLVAPLLIALVAGVGAPRWGRAGFYLAAGGTFAVLALGDMTPFFRWYVALPPGAATLRFPFRLFWLTGFCLAPLTALGIDALTGRADGVPRWSARLASIGLAAIVGIAAPGGLRAAEVLAVLAVVAAVLAASFTPLPRPAIRGLLLGAVILNVVAVPIAYRGHLLSSLEPLRTHASLFAALDPPVGDQDRVFVMGDASAALKFQLMQKTSTVLRVPGLFDYEALYGRRFGEYFTTLRRGVAGPSLLDVYMPIPLLGEHARRRLLDAAAVRYVVVSPSMDAAVRALGLEEMPVQSSNVRVYRNAGVLARARWVPRVAVVPDPDALLHRLAFGDDDLGRLALVETSPPSGFTGQPADGATATTRFVRHDPEHLVIEVNAPTRGFLVLADQYSAGWRARVNEDPVPLMRANYLFRLVEVPAGVSRVEFRYSPASVRLGAILSMLALAGLLGIGYAPRWTRRRAKRLRRRAGSRSDRS